MMTSFPIEHEYGYRKRSNKKQQRRHHIDYNYWWDISRQISNSVFMLRHKKVKTSG